MLARMNASKVCQDVNENAFQRVMKCKVLRGVRDARGRDARGRDAKKQGCHVEQRFQATMKKRKQIRVVV